MSRRPSSITAICHAAGATSLKPLAILCSVAILLALGAPAVRPAFAIELNAAWNGGAGNWSAGTNWSGGVVPNNSGEDSYSVFIDGGNPVVVADCGVPCLIVHRDVANRPGYTIALVAETTELNAATRAVTRAIALGAP